MCCFVYAYILVPETKGLTLEQVDRMLEETTPRTSAKWVPHTTFAHEMGMTEKGDRIEQMQVPVQEKAKVDEEV